MSNIIRYNLCKCGGLYQNGSRCDAVLYRHDYGMWVKFETIKHLLPTGAQQLQSKIAALIPAVRACSGYSRNGEAIRSVVEKMRQLSVVQ